MTARVEHFGLHAARGEFAEPASPRRTRSTRRRSKVDESPKVATRRTPDVFARARAVRDNRRSLIVSFWRAHFTLAPARGDQSWCGDGWCSASSRRGVCPPPIPDHDRRHGAEVGSRDAQARVRAPRQERRRAGERDRSLRPSEFGPVGIAFNCRELRRRRSRVRRRSARSPLGQSARSSRWQRSRAAAELDDAERHATGSLAVAARPSKVAASFAPVDLERERSAIFARESRRSLRSYRRATGSSSSTNCRCPFARPPIRERPTTVAPSRASTAVVSPSLFPCTASASASSRRRP